MILKKKDDDQIMDLDTAPIGLHSTPTVAKNVVLVGAAMLDGNVPKSKANVKGYVRALSDACAFRKAPLDFPHDSATRRIWNRHLGEAIPGPTPENTLERGGRSRQTKT